MQISSLEMSVREIAVHSWLDQVLVGVQEAVEAETHFHRSSFDLELLNRHCCKSAPFLKSYDYGLTYYQVEGQAPGQASRWRT